MSYSNVIGNGQQTVGLVAPAERVAVSANDSTQTVGSADRLQDDQAQISNSAGLLAEALSGSDVRASRIEALQQSIAAGTYNVPAADIADKLIQALTK